MALGDLMASRLVRSSSSPSPSSAAPSAPLPDRRHSDATDDSPVANGPEPRNGLEADEEKPGPVAYLPQMVVLCDQRHEGIDEAAAAGAGPSTSGIVTKWRSKDRVMDIPLYAAAVSIAPASELFTGFGAHGITTSCVLSCLC
jgi:regulatory associated protein of mTOR